MNGREFALSIVIVTLSLTMILLIISIVLVALYVHPAVGGIVAGLGCAAVGVYVYSSLHKTAADTGIEAYLFGHHWATYFAMAFVETLEDKHHLKKYKALMRTSLGIGETGWAFLPWGFFQTVRFPHTGNKVILHANKIYTRARTGGKINRYRVLLEGDPTLQVRFLSIRTLVASMGVLQLFRRYVDLTVECPIPHPHKDEGYTDSRLARVIWKHSTEVILESLRNAAGHFTWEGKGDIIRNKSPMETLVLWILAEPGSILNEAGILIRPLDENTHEPIDLTQCVHRAKDRSMHMNSFFGAHVLSVDFNVEGVDFAKVTENESAATQAVNVPFIASRTRIQLAEEGAGRASAAKAVVDDLDVDGEMAYTMNALRDRSGDVNLTQFGGSVMNLFRSIAGKRRR